MELRCFSFDFGSVAGKMVVQQYADFCIFDFVHTHECDPVFHTFGLGWFTLFVGSVGLENTHVLQVSTFASSDCNEL